MKNKTSACNLQVISHLPTSGKWALRHITLGEGDARATSPVMHTRSQRLWGSLLLVDQNLLFFVCFLEARGGKAVKAQQELTSPRAARMGRTTFRGTWAFWWPPSTAGGPAVPQGREGASSGHISHH